MLALRRQGMNRTLEAVERMRLAIHYHLKSLIIVIAAGFACRHFASFTPHGVCEFEQPSWLTWYVQLPGGRLKLFRQACRPCETVNGLLRCLSRIRSSCRHVFLYSRSPMPAVRPPFGERLGLRSLPRCARPVASACRCSWICLRVASRSPLANIDFLKLLFDARLLAHFVNKLGRLRLGEIFPERERLACLFRQGL